MKEIVVILLCFLMVELGFPMMTQTQTQLDQTQVEKQNKPQALPGKSDEQPKKKKFPWLAVVTVAVLTAGIVLLVSACKTPTDPIEPIAEYYDLLQVWYTEDPADLSFPIVPNAAALDYQIYDPNPQHPLIKENHEWTSSSYRCGVIYLKQIGEYLYTGYIPNVRIQNSKYDGKHIVRAHDINLKGDDRITAKGVVVDKSKDLEIVGWDLRFNVFR